MTWDVDHEFEQQQVAARALRHRTFRRLMVRVVLFSVSAFLIVWYISRLLIPQPSLYVRPDEAILRIPIEKRISWDWNEAVPQPKLEYGWNVTISDVSHRYMLGYMLFNTGKEAAQSGSLSKLLQFGHPLLQRGVDDNFFEVEDVPVSYSFEQNTLVIRVQDAATVERVFANKPATATLEITTPYEPTRQNDVVITYQP